MPEDEVFNLKALESPYIKDSVGLKKCALGQTALDHYCSENRNDFYFMHAEFTVCEGGCDFSSGCDNDQDVQYNR